MCIYRILFLLFSIGISQVYAQPYFPHKINGKYGYIDTLKNWVISPRFDLADYYKNDRAVAIVNDSLFLIYKINSISYLPGLKDYKTINNAYTRVQNKTGKWALANNDLVPITNFMYDNIYFAEPYFEVKQNGLKGLIDSTGKTVLPSSFSNIVFLPDNRFKTTLGNENYVFEYKDTLLLKLKTSYLEYNQRYPNVYIKRGKKVKSDITIYNLDGDSIYHCFKCEIFNSYNQFFIFKQDKGFKAINVKDQSRNFYFTFPKDIAYNKLTPSYLYIKRTGDYYIDSSNNPIKIEKDIDSIIVANSDYLFIRKDSKWGMMHRNGYIVIPIDYTSIELLENNYVEAYKKTIKVLYNLSTNNPILYASSIADITVDSISILVYSTNGSKLYEINENYELTDSAFFKNLNRITVGRKTIVNGVGVVPLLPIVQTQGTNNSRVNRWFILRNRYGLVSSDRKDTLLKPMAYSVSAINDSLDIFTILTGGSLIVRIEGNHSISSNYAYGIINNRTGKMILKPFYYFMDVNQFADTNFKVVRAVDRNSKFILLRKDNYLPVENSACDYISPSKNGFMRLFYDATFFSVSSSRKNSKINNHAKLLYSDFDFADFGRYNTRMDRFANIYVRAKSVNISDINGSIIWHKDSAAKLMFVDEGKFGNFICVNHHLNYGVYNSSNQMILPFEYSNISRLSSDNRYFVLRTKNLKYGYLNEEGIELSDAVFNHAEKFDDEYAWAKIGDSMALIDRQGAIKFGIAPNTRISTISEGISAYRVRKGWIITDIEGNQIGDEPYKVVKPFHNNSAAVMYRDKWGLLDANGNWLIQPTYEGFEAENANTVVFSKGNNFYFVNRDGAELSKIKLKGVMKALNDFYFVLDKGDKKIIFNNKGVLYSKKSFRNDIREENDTILAVSSNRLLVWNQEGKRIASLAHKGGVKAIDKGIMKIYKDKNYGNHTCIEITAADKHLYPSIFTSNDKVIRLHKPLNLNFASNVKFVNLNTQHCIQYNAFIYEFISASTNPSTAKKNFILADSLGNILNENYFNSIQYAGNGLFIATMIDENSAIVTGILNQTGIWIVQPKFLSISSFANGIAVYSKENDYWIADGNGKLIGEEHIINFTLHDGYYCLRTEDKMAWWHPTKGWLTEMEK